MLLSEKHISIISENIVKEICEPLFASTEVNYFIFARFYDNGTHIALPSDAKWHQYFWSKNYQSNSEVRLMPGKHLWIAQEKLSQACLDARNFFNIDNKLDIVERSDGYYEVFGFAGQASNNKIIDFYFNRIDVLKKHILYFKEKAYPLIKTCEKMENRLSIKIVNKPKKESAASKYNMDRYKFNIRQFKFPNITLSKREVDCLLLLIRGRTAPEIGEELNISYKTAESYIESAKYKFCCHTKAELFDKAYKINLPDLIDKNSFDTD